MRNKFQCLTAVAVLLGAGLATAADPAIVCQTAKLKSAAKYGACRLGAEAKAVKKGVAADVLRCAGTFEKKWSAAEAKAGSGVCPSEGDVASIGAQVAAHTSALATLLEGSALPPEGCTPRQFPASGQTETYGPGDDGDLRPGAVLSFLDNGDGTITDLNTGLMWEKKVGWDWAVEYCDSEAGTCANPHDANNLYRWSSTGSDYDGEVVTIFLEQLNNRCSNNPSLACSADVDCQGPGGPCGFAGHRDWRLPNVKEFLSILDYSLEDDYATILTSAFHGENCGTSCMALSDPDCGCDSAERYWTSTSTAGFEFSAWRVHTGDGRIHDNTSKGYSFHARAVRNAQ